MIGSRFHGSRNDRRAFTLLEVLLTLFLLVILAALAWPALEEPFAGIRLRKAAERIRAEWSTARVEAMDAGEVYLFRCTVEEGSYRVETYSAAGAQENTAAGDLRGDAPQAISRGGGAGQPIEGTLPEGVTFVKCEIVSDTREAMVASELKQSGGMETVLSDPILFYPDGTTSTARLVLKNEHDRYIELLLRGLTGVVSVGEVSSSEELSP